VFDGMRDKLSCQGRYELVVRPSDKTWFCHAAPDSLPDHVALSYIFTISGAAPSRLTAEWLLPQGAPQTPLVRMGMPLGSPWSVPELKLSLLDPAGSHCSVEGFTIEQLKGMLQLRLEHASICLGSSGIAVEVRACAWGVGCAARLPRPAVALVRRPARPLAAPHIDGLNLVALHSRPSAEDAQQQLHHRPRPAHHPRQPGAGRQARAAALGGRPAAEPRSRRQGAAV
jgi:hypothetical protein